MSTRTVEPKWHALLSAVEREPGHWHMHVNGDEPPYACIRLLDVTRDGQPVRAYRIVTWAPASADRRLVGYHHTLRAACDHARAHREHEARYGSEWMQKAAEATAYGSGVRA